MAGLAASVGEVWEPFRGALEQVAAGRASHADWRVIVGGNGVLLDRMNAMVLREGSAVRESESVSAEGVGGVMGIEIGAADQIGVDVDETMP